MKSQLLHTEKTMFDGKGKDRDEIKALQQEVKDKSTVVETRDRQLNQLKDDIEKIKREFASRKADFESSKFKLENEVARSSKGTNGSRDGPQ